MKKFTALLSLTFMLIFSVLHSQDLGPRLTHEMTPEEKLRKHEIGRDFTPTNPPAPPVRMVAEFEEMQSVLIRYPFGIPMSLIKEMADDCKVKTIVASTSQQQTVLSQYEAAGVNTANCEWLLAPSNSYWTRDYGPWFVVDGSYDVGISDFPYNRPRPADDNVPVVLATDLEIPLYGMNLIHTGGNWMCDGIGVAASTELVWEENPTLSHQQVDTLVWDYLGIKKYHVLTDPLDEYIDHIDCWGKFLDVDKVLIGQVPQSDYRYQDFEFVANFFAFQTSSYGTPYQVYRVYTPGTSPGTPYTNSLILNKKVLVPITGSQWDDEALATYEEAMPGYEIVGVMHNTWENTDALHCRAKGIADLGMLHISHMPLLGNKAFRLEWELQADIIPYTGLSAISDSLRCFYRFNDDDFQSIPLQYVNAYQYKAILPLALPGTEVSYYLRAADYSGRKKNHPYIGAPDPHIFTVGYAGDAVVSPDTMVYLTEADAIDGLTFNLSNYTDGELVINDIETEHFDLPFPWYIDPLTIELPYIMAVNEVLPLNVKIAMIVDGPMGELVVDTLDIFTEFGHHKVVLKADSDLITGIADPLAKVSTSIIESISPNPINSHTKISISLGQSARTSLAVFNLQGQLITVLENQMFSAGNHTIVWNGKDDSGNEVSSGIYLLKLKTERGVDFKKLIISK